LQDGALHDNVYLKFSGDPTLTFEKIERLISRLSLAGIRKIEKEIIIDNSLFDEVTRSPGTVWDDQDYCFGAPLRSALIVDRNCVIAALKPALEQDQLAQLELPQYPQFIHFENQVTTQHEKNKNCDLDVKYLDGKSGATSTYIVSGCIKH